MTFNPETFMQSTVDAPLSTEYLLVPEGEFVATIDDFDSSAFEQQDFTDKKGAKAGTPGSMTKFNIPFVIQDDKVKQEMSRDKVVITKQVILDLDENERLLTDKGRNVELGRVRAAAGQEDKTPWGFMDLRGAGPMMIKVVHRTFDRKDGTKGTRAEVDRVVKIT
jgi:hypothetical protein